MTAKVTTLNCKTTLDICPDDVLAGAECKLKDVLLIGWDENDSLYVSSSKSDIAELNMWIDLAKQYLLDQLGEDR